MAKAVIVLFLLFFLTANFSFAQTSPKLDATMAFIKSKGIRLNTVTPPPGFTVYYDCDSLLFMKGIFGDTIKIWTPAVDSHQELEDFHGIIENESFGVTQFAKNIDNDGRIIVSSYYQTDFIYRNDSLFEIRNSNPARPGTLIKLFDDYFNKKIDKDTYETRLDSLNKIEESQAVYTPKLIFAKKMFQKGKKVKLPKKLNFERDEIELESQWQENGKTCYLVRINNKVDGQETTYAYAIDQDMKFVYWEGCAGRSSPGGSK
ncbi:hypothetical protein [Paraflavitalea sp. CAU 1676]|uniref:hypothetical protein n=1 Tax=Paraflavitalea sp. CAU 1676 TaxID=3032598 RepID=UPI0023DBCFAF|nr:hypothetical protein [Paraflavitalea sp. CAU 1676]MDF2188086.1 hypothetical protein [Paraflavitalea sp. CAU 1676]